MSQFFNYYQLLDVSTTASTRQINLAYKKKALIYHPDKNGGSQVANDMFKLLNNAKDCLTNPSERLRYDYEIGVKSKPNPRAEYKTEPEVEYVVIKEEPDLKETIQLGLAALAVGYAFGRIRKSRKPNKRKK